VAAVPQAEILNARPGDLVEWARTGRIRMPPFQRSYRWNSHDVALLFDSIVRHYPIGTLLLWQRPAAAEAITIGPLRIDAPARGDAFWIVDGQQRLTSLISALTADADTVDPRFRIFFDLATGTFHSVPRTQFPGPHSMPISVALDTGRANAWIRDRPDLSDTQVRQADQVVAAIRDYTIPLYVIKTEDENVVRDIFGRMNASGHALTSAEVFNSLHSVSIGEKTGDLHSLAERVAAFGFGDISENNLLRCILAIRDPRVPRTIRTEFTSDDERLFALEETERAISSVVDFLRAVADIPHIRLLPYDFYLPVLARFVALFGPPNGRVSELLRRWLWRAAALDVGHYAGIARALRANLEMIEGDPLSSAQRLLTGLQAPRRTEMQPMLTPVRLSAAQTRLNLLGMLSLRPRSLAGPQRGGILGVNELFDAKYFLVQLIPKDPFASQDSLATRILHPRADSEGIRKLIMAGELTIDELHSHALDEISLDLLRQAQYEMFIEYRSERLARIIAEQTQAHALFGFRDGPDFAALFEDEVTDGA